MELPAWFVMNRGAYEAPPGPAQKGRQLFLDRTLRATTALLREFILAERFCQAPGLLQKLDPRAKLLGLLLLLAGASLLHSAPLLYIICGLAAALATLSRIETAFFLKRIWLFVALFGGLLALPATLNVFTPGEEVLVLYTGEEVHRFGPFLVPAQIALTREGISSALLLTGRMAASLSLVLLLTLTTPWAELLKALRLLRVPAIYVQTLGMALRYLWLICHLAEEMHLARKSRTIRQGRARAERRWVAAQVGGLFRRSMRLCEEVHQAMVARGYQGEVRILSTFLLRPRDGFWLAGAALLAGLLIYYGR